MLHRLLPLLACAALDAAEPSATAAGLAAPLRDPFAAPGLSDADPDAPDWPRALALARRGSTALVLLALGEERALVAPGEGVTLARRRFQLKAVVGEEALLADDAGGERLVRVISQAGPPSVR